MAAIVSAWPRASCWPKSAAAGCPSPPTRARWSTRGYAYLAVGIAEDHRLAPALQRHAARVLRSRVYAVYWPDGPAPAFDRGMTLHLETATL